MHSKVAARITGGIFLIGILSTPLAARAAGFELLEQSGEGMGTAFAGSATGFGDGSEAYFNPASMTSLTANTVSANVDFIYPHAKFNNDGSSLSPELGGGPLTGNMGGDAGSLNTLPNIYGVYKITDDISAGLGINSPFGLSSDYNDTWVGRYSAVDSELTSVNINPAIAVKVSDMVSLGANMQIIYGHAKLTNAIDFGSIGTATLGLPTAAAAGLLPQSADGYAKVTGDGWGVGMGLGATVQPLDDVTFGVSWRSEVHLKISGDADFTVPANASALTSTGQFTNTNASADITLPQSIDGGVAYKLSDQVTLLGDAVWTEWQSFKDLTVNFDSTQPPSTDIEDWKNSWRFSLGAKYKPCPPWTFKAGFTFDESPIRSGEFRTPRIPDNNRYWMAFGVDYDITDSTTLGFNYAHIFVPGGAQTQISAPPGDMLSGSWDLSIEVASLSLVTRF